MPIALLDFQLMRGQPAGDFDYEAHGRTYATVRRPDQRIAALVHDALGSARTVLNVGAGAGSYEPSDRQVVAVEPSATMRSQRRPDLAPAVDGVAERLPFDADSFDAAMAMITLHQWPEPFAGLAEMRRVSRGPVVVLTFDGDSLDRLWLGEYCPELFEAEQRRYPRIEKIAQALGPRTEVLEVPIPLDCTDGFTETYYGRPEMFLDPAVRACQSAWGFVDQPAIDRGLATLATDLDSGAWDERFGALRTQPQFVGALRLITGRPG
jgi:hypothetical protein